MTFQLGGPHLIACAKGSDDDRAWFVRHHGRNHRLRKPIGRERALRGGGWPRRVKAMIVVRQVKPGARIRLEVGVRGTPLNAEEIARQLFELAAEDTTWVADVEQAIRDEAP
jgi:hypothetical protein